MLAYHSDDNEGFALTWLNVLDLNGDDRGAFARGSYDLRLLDASGRKIVLGGWDDPTRVWTPGAGMRLVTRKATSFADLRTNSLAVQATKHRWAMTTLTRPNRVRWQAWFRPVQVSPNAKRVVGLAVSRRNGDLLPRVQVRSLSSGRVVAQIPFRGGEVHGPTMAWSGNRSVVFQASARAVPPNPVNQVLVRCGLGGRCARVSAAAAPAGDF